jgi:hypothetical protein
MACSYHLPMISECATLCCCPLLKTYKRVTQGCLIEKQTPVNKLFYSKDTEYLFKNSFVILFVEHSGIIKYICITRYA